ncbi:MAG: DUF481 domain-containing protein, partial [Ignavibacteria bacterium]
KKYIVLLLIFGVWANLFSQGRSKDTVTTRALEKSPWTGGMSIRGFYMMGNTNKFYGMGTGEIKRQDSIYTLDLNATVDYGESNKIKDENSFFGDFSADLFHHNLLSPLVMQIGEYNFSRGIVFRSQTGGGLKLNFIQHPEHKTSISLAVIYDYTNLVNIPGNEDTRRWRLSWRFKTVQILFGNRLKLSNVTFFQPSMTALSNTIWRVETVLDAPILSFLSLQAAYLYTREDNVSVGRKHSDHKVTFGLNVSSNNK